MTDDIEALNAEIATLRQERDDLDLTWAAASEFIRDICEAVGREQPPSEGKVDLPALALEVVGQIEQFKCGQEAAEAENARLRADVKRLSTVQAETK